MSKNPKNDPNEPKIADVITAFTSEMVVKAAVIAAEKAFTGPKRRGTKHVSRQLSNPRRRKRAAEGSRRVQAPDRRALQRGILHHQHGWQGCSSLSLRGVAADRGEAGEVAH